MSAMQIFALNAARAGRSHLEQLAGILVQDATAPAAQRQQVAAALTEVNDVIDTLEKALGTPEDIAADLMVEVITEGSVTLPALPKRVPGATLDPVTRGGRNFLGRRA